MNAIYILSDQVGAGKTALAVTLASLARREGISVAVLSPFDHLHDEYYAKLLGQARNGEHTASLADSPESVAQRCRRAAEGKDSLIVDGSADVGIETQQEIVEALDAHVVGITQHVQGKSAADISDWARAFPERLIGVVVNGRTQYQGTEVTSRFIPDLEALGIRTLGVIPEDRKLVSCSIDQIVQHLDGRYLLGEEYGDRIIEHFLVGGMGLDRGTLYFGIREDKGVIVRGDRPDIQMAALHTPTSCLILTNGTEPVEYITHEADLEETPIVIVDTNTLDTMQALSTLQERARFDHPDKLARFSSLLRQHVSLGPVFDRLGIKAAVREDV